MPTPNYDAWKTTPPEPPAEVFVAQCTNCDSDLYSGEEALYYSVDGTYYCDDACFISYLKRIRDVEECVLEPPEGEW